MCATDLGETGGAEEGREDGAGGGVHVILGEVGLEVGFVGFCYWAGVFEGDVGYYQVDVATTHD